MIWRFASRYVRTKKSTQAINIISWVSMGAIAVGTAALLVVLSVFNGFEGLVKSLYSSFYPEVKVSPEYGKSMFVSADKLDSLRAIPEVADLSKTFEEKSLIQYNDEKLIVTFKAVDDHFKQVTGVKDRMVSGSFDLGNEEKPKAVLGSGVAAILGIDSRMSPIPLVVYLPRSGGGGGMMAQQSFYTGQLIPEGTFAIQQDFDDHYVLTNLSFLQSLMGKQKEEVTSLELSIKKGADVNQLKTNLLPFFPVKEYKIEDRYEQNRSLYLVMQTEKWAVYAILCFIFIIAAFNMIGALSMLVIEKKKDISILKAMGAKKVLIQKIFLTEGFLVAAVGAVIGTLFALVLCLGQSHFGWIKLGGDSFVIDAYPVQMEIFDFILVWVTIIVISLLASWYPANKAANQPIGLKSE